MGHLLRSILLGSSLFIITFKPKPNPIKKPNHMLITRVSHTGSYKTCHSFLLQSARPKHQNPCAATPSLWSQVCFLSLALKVKKRSGFLRLISISLCVLLGFQRWPSRRITPLTTSPSRPTRMASRSHASTATLPPKGYFLLLSGSFLFYACNWIIIKKRLNFLVVYNVVVDGS